eukprot:gene2136-2002_t
MSTLNVHRELLLRQSWIDEMINNNYEIIQSESCPKKMALLQHQTCIIWIVKCLSKLIKQHAKTYEFEEKQLLDLVEGLVNICFLHPSLFVLETELKFNNAKIYFVVCVFLACKMYDDFQDLCYIQNRNYVLVEACILQKLEYNLVIQYRDFFGFIHDFSKDISNQVSADVLECSKLYF